MTCNECIIFNTNTLFMIIIILIIYIINNSYYFKIKYNTYPNINQPIIPKNNIEQPIILKANIEQPIILKSNIEQSIVSYPDIIKSNEILKNNILKSNAILKKDIINSLLEHNTKESKNSKNIDTYTENIYNEDTYNDNMYNDNILDKRVLYDDFVPPIKRYKPPYRNRKYINIPTQGMPDNYQLLGVAMNNNNTKAYNLFGRQTHPSSSEYEYYIIGNIDNTQIKIPLSNTKEIFDKDSIRVLELNDTFLVNLYKYDTPKYYPI